MRFPRLALLGSISLAACATPENRRELTGPYYPYEPIPYSAPKRDNGGRVISPQVSPNETTVWYGPDTREKSPDAGEWAGTIPTSTIRRLLPASSSA
ncbi:MAG: hypothetical protein ACKOFH_01240 [Chthoniobacterales bacterium]